MPVQRKRKQVFSQEDAAQEQQLFDLLFGDTQKVVTFGSEEVDGSPPADEQAGSASDAEDFEPSVEDTPEGSSLQPAWSDEDDEAVAKDINAERRLKKLRTSYVEAVVSGEEYSQRLREQ